MKRQQIGGWAALVNAGIAVGNLVVVFAILGAAAAADPAKIAELVVRRPAPLLWLEFFKILAASASVIVIYVLHQRFSARARRGIKIITLCGVAAALLLLLAGVIGGFAIRQAGEGWGGAWLPAGVTYQSLNTFINRLGLAALFANGLWLLGINWLAHKHHDLPVGLCYLGLLLGGASLLPFFLPPLALLGLLLGLVWSVWLGRVLLRWSSI